MPKEERFFDLFEKHAQTLVAGSQHLRAVLDGGPGLSENCARVSTEEEAADAVTRDVMVAVRRTFITPFDRGDIQDLISSMDDAIDQMQQTTKAITMFEVTEFDPSMRAIGDNIVVAADNNTDGHDFGLGENFKTGVPLDAVETALDRAARNFPVLGA